MKKIFPLSISIVIAELAGLIGSIFTTSSVGSWYPTLLKPEWTPPSWIFAPAWVTLYALMGIAAYLVWQKRKSARGVRPALLVYGLQLILNSAWSIIFFGLQRPDIAFFELCALLLLIVINTALFWRIDKRAGWLLLPYLAWSTFALILNFNIWQMNAY